MGGAPAARDARGHSRRGLTAPARAHPVGEVPAGRAGPRGRERPREAVGGGDVLGRGHGRPHQRERGRRQTRGLRPCAVQYRGLPRQRALGARGAARGLQRGVGLLLRRRQGRGARALQHDGDRRVARGGVSWGGRDDEEGRRGASGRGDGRQPQVHRARRALRPAPRGAQAEALAGSAHAVGPRGRRRGAGGQAHGSRRHHAAVLELGVQHLEPRDGGAHPSGAAARVQAAPAADLQPPPRRVQQLPREHQLLHGAPHQPVP
mmetsp:Transcript_1407/g.4832  ORF Transcript_1407/g.4832 Transcript_1407/m.4832 type:complete len:263 (-) Transcript_1407:1048-1836(-)